MKMPVIEKVLSNVHPSENNTNMHLLWSTRTRIFNKCSSRACYVPAKHWAGH